MRRPRIHLPWLLLVVSLAVKQLAVVWMLDITPGPWLVPLSVVISVALCAWILWLPPRFELAAALAIGVFVTLALLADLFYFRYFRAPLTVAALLYARQLGEVSTSIATIPRATDWLFFVDLPIVAGAFLLLAREAPRWSLKRVALVTGVCLAALATIVVTDPTRRLQYRGLARHLGRLGSVGFHLTETVEYAAGRVKRPVASAEEIAETRRWLEEKRRTPRGPLFGVAKGANLIVIQVEALQAFAVGLEIGGVAVTPALDALSRESLRFTDFWTQIGCGATSDAELLVNCSQYPLGTSAAYYENVGNDFRALPRILRDAGYASAAFHGMTASFWNRSMIYPRLGFERFHALDDFDFDEHLGMGLSDVSFARQLPAKFAALQEPFHAFAITLSSHLPYDDPALARAGLPLGTLAGTTLGRYLDAIRYTDGALGQLLDSLRASGLMDRSVIALYGDHEGLRNEETIPMGPLLDLDPGDAVAWAKANRRVPLLIRLPHGAHAGEIGTVGGELDLAPTLLALLGISIDGEPLFGQDLLTTTAPLVVQPDGTATDGERMAFASLAGGVDRCFAYGDGKALDPAACDALAARAREELDLSRAVIRKNMITALKP